MDSLRLVARKLRAFGGKRENFSERKEIGRRKERALGVARFHVREETRAGRENLGEGEEGYEQTKKK